MNAVWADISPRFVAQPDWQRSTSLRGPLFGIGALFVLGLGGSLVALVVSVAAAHTGYENTLEASLEDLTLAGQFALVALYAPLLEELVYRLPLTVPLHFGALGGAAALGALTFVGGNPVDTVVAVLFATVAVAACVVWAQSLAASAGSPGRRSWKVQAQDWWLRHPRWPVWSSIGAFALVHLSNYDVEWSLAAVLAIPFVVSPQIWLGLMFTIARVRYGWLAGVGLHAAHNLTIWSVHAALTA